MLLKQKHIILLLFLICTNNVFSQNGSPFITHFKECKEIETQNWSICQDEQNVMLFANRRGIMSFDGQRWDITKIPYIPFCLKKNPINNKVYVGANNNYGFIERDSKGFYKYFSLSSDTSDIGIISKIIFTDSTIFFYGDKTITRHSLNNINNIKRWYAKSGKSFTGMFLTQKNTFINVSGEGLYRIESDTLFPIVTGFYTKDNEILFSLPYNKQRVLVGTDNSELYTFDGIKYYNYDINDDGYLNESILSDGQIISDTLYAFGTLYGGVEIVHKKTGKIVYTVNYQNGLPDDEIYSLGLDNNNGLWVTHEFGVSRVDFELPIRNFTSYPGLEGNLISSVWYNNELYVATSEGVYFLDQVKDYNEVSIWIKSKSKNVKTKTSSSDKGKGNQPTEDENETNRPVKNLFSRLFRKNEPKKETSKPNIQETNTKNTKPKYVKKTVSTLKAINYIFKKIEGINEKCSQLVATNHGILAGSNNGLFQIENHKAAKIKVNRYINQISSQLNGRYFIATNTGLFSVIFKNGKWQEEYNFVDFTEAVYTISIVDNFQLWLGGNNLVYYLLTDSLGQINEFKNYIVKTDFPEKYKLDYISDTLSLFLESGVFYYDKLVDSFKLQKNIAIQNDSRSRVIINQQDKVWVQNQNKWNYLGFKKIWTDQELSYLKLFENISSIVSDNENNLWIVNNSNQIFKITHSKHKLLIPNFDIYFNSISNEQETLFDLNDIILNPNTKAIYINTIAPYYIKNNSTQYQYFLEGLMDNWSKWSDKPDINLMVNSGNYNLHVRAKDILGNTSKIKTINLKVEPPFTESIWFYTILAIVVIVLFITISKIRERKHIKDKKILEQKVKERTLEIQEQKEEIEVQRDKIILQLDEIYRQKEEITDSINYASRIQNAILPMKEHFERVFSDYFILFKPRDIVSGDFYWIAEDENKAYFTAADCTGHGVPGAFMSMLSISSLNEIFANRNSNHTAARILTLLREKIKFSLHQTGKEGETQDGLDMALCVYHKNKNILEYAGAYNPLYLIRDNFLEEYKADRMPIGIYHVEKEYFTNHLIEVKKGDVIYIFSDGYVDQFGGPIQTKFKASNLKTMLLEIHDKPMKEQKIIMEERFAKWKGKLDQIDDVLFMGLKF